MELGESGSGEEAASGVESFGPRVEEEVESL